VKTSSMMFLVLGIVVLFSLLAVQFYPTIQDYMAGNSMWNGIRNFSRENKVNELSSLSGLNENTSKTTLVAIPYLEYTAEDLDRLDSFVSAGNLLVLMDDFGYGNQVLERLGLNTRFNGNYLLDPLFCYKNAYFPRIVEFDAAVKSAGIQAIVLNHATCLDVAGDSGILAWSSNTSFLDINRNGIQDESEKSGPFPVAAEYRVGKGLVRLVSDPSLITNSMVGQNDNRRFDDYLFSSAGFSNIVSVDYSHLSKSPLDTSKQKLKDMRVFLNNPYVTIGLIVAVFALTAGYTFRKGGIFG
jgi:hypothetical protein